MLVAVARDVAERRAYETGLLEAMMHAEEARVEIEEASRLKAAILANMSHELRTPLTAILGYAEILCDEVAPDLTEYAETVRAGGHRLLSTLNDILDLARLDSASDAGVPEPFDAGAAVRRIARALEPKARDAGLALHVADDGGDATVVQPPEAFGRVVDILIGNAIKFTERGEVRVNLHTAPGFVALRVQDTGVGIGEAFLADVFEPFTQESDGQNRRFEGNGLGLAVARRLVHHMGAEIRVWSRKGEGSLFEIALPRVAPGAPPAPGPTADLAADPVDAPADRLALSA
jgi:signal transduction histidine kinase